MSQTPSSKPREDPPASGPAPEVQVPGDSSPEQHPPRLSEGAPGRVTFSNGDPGDEQFDVDTTDAVLLVLVSEVTEESLRLNSVPVEFDDEQPDVEGVAV